MMKRLSVHFFRNNIQMVGRCMQPKNGTRTLSWAQDNGAPTNQYRSLSHAIGINNPLMIGCSKCAVKGRSFRLIFVPYVSIRFYCPISKRRWNYRPVYVDFDGDCFGNRQHYFHRHHLRADTQQERCSACAFLWIGIGIGSSHHIVINDIIHCPHGDTIVSFGIIWHYRKGIDFVQWRGVFVGQDHQ